MTELATTYRQAPFGQPANPLIATVKRVANQTYVTPLKAGTTVVSATVGTVTGSTTISVSP